MSSLFLFTGENSYELREECRRWMREYIEKHGPENLLLLDGPRMDFRALLDEVSAAPFIAGKRLVIVRGMPKVTKEEIERLVSVIHPDCIVLFCEGSPDRRLTGVKALLATSTVKEFKRRTGRLLLEWMEREATSLGIHLDPVARDLLLQIVGDDQDALRSELEKLSIRGGTISREAVQELAVPSGEQEIWTLTSLLSRGDLPAALHYARVLQTQGEDPFSLWNILLWMLRSLVAISIATAEGHRQPPKIASVTGVPFPTVRTLLSLAEKCDLSTLRILLDWAVETDMALKTGGYRASGDAPQELQALIDECIVRIAELSLSRV